MSQSCRCGACDTEFNSIKEYEAHKKHCGASRTFEKYMAGKVYPIQNKKAIKEI